MKTTHYLFAAMIGFALPAAGKPAAPEPHPARAPVLRPAPKLAPAKKLRLITPITRTPVRVPALVRVDGLTPPPAVKAVIGGAAGANVHHSTASLNGASFKRKP